MNCAKVHHTFLTAQGDNDPIDVVEVGERQLPAGGVFRVKPLGLFGFIDEGEVDWKVIAISQDDPKANFLNDIGDVDRFEACCTKLVGGLFV